MRARMDDKARETLLAEIQEGLDGLRPLVGRLEGWHHDDEPIKGAFAALDYLVSDAALRWTA